MKMMMTIATLSLLNASHVAPLPHRILFIGDSFTGIQEGLYSHVVSLARADDQRSSVTESHVTIGGATLKRQWEIGTAVKQIDSNAYDTVVIQDDIPEINVDYFRQYATAFVEEARKHGARPILYMTWSYDRLSWISMKQIIDAHRKISKELHVEVAPAGLAWKNVWAERPDIDLFSIDREHPNADGMYLNACVVYSTLFNKNPIGISYHPSNVTSEDATYLQNVAWRTVNSNWREK